MSGVNFFLCKVTRLNFWARGKYIAIQFSSTISIHVCPVFLVDDKVFVLLVLLKEMNMLCESEILSFFVYGVYQGGLPGGVSPRFPFFMSFYVYLILVFKNIK